MTDNCNLQLHWLCRNPQFIIINLCTCKCAGQLPCAAEITHPARHFETHDPGAQKIIEQHIVGGLVVKVLCTHICKGYEFEHHCCINLQSENESGRWLLLWELSSLACRQSNSSILPECQAFIIRYTKSTVFRSTHQLCAN